MPDVIVKEAKRLYRKSPRTGKRRSLRIITKELTKLGYNADSGNSYGAESIKRMVSGNGAAKMMMGWIENRGIGWGDLFYNIPPNC